MSLAQVLAIVPARAGSNRLPGKNKKYLADKPLISWTFDAARDIPEICDILVSTDDPEIVGIAKSQGVLAPWLRPPELATATANTVDVAIHALNWYEENHQIVDGILILQPTSPFRSSETIKLGINLFIESGFLPVVSVSQTHAHPLWTFTLENDSLVPFIDSRGLNLRSQDLPPAYVLNGNLYLIASNTLRKSKQIILPNTRAIVVESVIESLDIDTEEDWFVAEAYCKRYTEFQG